jgi:hypothetical protein
MPKSRRSRRSRKSRRMRGGAWLDMIAEATRIQAEANAMDPASAPYLVAGSTAVAIYLHDLIQNVTEDRKEGQTLFASLKKPDDLDFKYRGPGRLFYDHIVRNEHTCVYLAGFRCCDLCDSPIFDPLPGTVTQFSKLEFHMPSHFRRMRIHRSQVSGVELLGIKELYDLYLRHEVAENAPKISALQYIMRMVEKYPEIAEKYYGQICA